ncbi:glycine receptor subunit alpha-2-like [Physella acuta]|uniref:glycine receptor subunit alpha-2-like n=1 Tax=Physella acuta TaxID=109671 RepID=UPI0027DE8B52|nr:glycine receptor subunit alpha-2-like [Physella acuta]
MVIPSGVMNWIIEYTFLLLLLPGLTCTDGLKSETPEKLTKSTVMGKTMIQAKSSRNDLKITPPNYDTEEPVRIQVLLYVSSIDDVNEANMDFTVGILLHLRWVDSRFNSNYADNYFKTHNSSIDFDSENIKQVWVPDIFFPNEKRGSFHNIMSQNQIMSLNPNSTLLYISRLTMTLSCPMDLKNYPFDKQICTVLIMSFGYTYRDVEFEWMNGTEAVEIQTESHFKPIIVNSDVMLPQFEIKDVRANFCNRRYHQREGNHSCLQAEFHLARNIGFYMVQMYIPSVLIVMLSWISFWLNVNSVPGRVSLGLLTVLTMTTQSSNVNAALPKVSYTKAIDVWMSTCLVFVFAALLEFAVVNVLSRKDTILGFSLRGLFSIPKDTEAEEGALTAPEASPTLDNFKKDTSGKKLFAKRGIVYAEYVDVIARFLFPVCFSVFIMSYWLHYVNAD